MYGQVDVEKATAHEPEDEKLVKAHINEGADRSVRSDALCSVRIASDRS